MRIDLARDSRPRSAQPPRPPAFALFCAYALFVVYATLLPFQFITDGATLRAKRHWINWNPTHLVSGEPTPVTDLVSNILFFIPLGIVGFHAQRQRRSGAAVLRCTAVSAVLSLSVESLQYLTPARNPATSDVMMNTLGALLGGLAAAGFQRQLRSAVRRRVTSWMQREPLLPILVGYALLVALSAVVPFDLTLAISWLKRGVRAAHLHPTRDPLQWLGEARMVLQYAVLAGLGYRVATRLRPGRAAARALECVVAATIMVLGLELAQLAVRSRVTSATDVVAGIGGGVIGVVVAWSLGGGRRARHGWKLVAVAYMITLCLQALQPFDFHFDWTAMRGRLSHTTLIPYSSYYYKANMAAMADFLDGLLAYAPLAFVLARLRAARGAAPGPRPGVAVVLLCALFALLLEVLQLGVPRRAPEISDVLTAALGGGFGVYAWRWVQYLNTSMVTGALWESNASLPPGRLQPHPSFSPGALQDGETAAPIAPASS